MRKNSIRTLMFFLFVTVCYFGNSQNGYDNFDLSVYCRVYETNKMKDLKWLSSRIDYLEKVMKVEKIYIETHRDQIIADKETILNSKKYLEKKGIKVAGGITLVMSERDHFRTFCYSNPEHLKKIQEILEFTASVFDEIILDDFYFTNCKCDKCIAQKGDQSWSAFRMKQLTDVARTNIVAASKAVNPKVKVIIKYPNWYEHFHYLGFNLADEPKIFDGIYTGTETRDPKFSHQHLQAYQSYSIMRYFENVAPDKNGGGWIDPYGIANLDRYGEQISLTAFSKPKEITLFCLESITEEMLLANGKTEITSNVSPVAGNVLKRADNFLNKLGKPVGLPCYRPFNSVGEDFLHNYLGMIGIPIEITTTFPENSSTILLTENAKYDNEIVNKIKQHLTKGNNVIITSGLLASLQGAGIEEIADIRCPGRKFLSNEFSNFRESFISEKEILLPQVIYPTNDSWEVVTSFSSGNGYPLLLQANYSKGMLYVLTIPDNSADLYLLPAPVINMLKRVICSNLNIKLESSSQVSLFSYDNNSCIVHSFLSEGTAAKVIFKGQYKQIKDLETGRPIDFKQVGNNAEVTVYLRSHDYKVLKAE